MAISDNRPGGAAGLINAVSARVHLVKYALFAIAATVLNLLCQNSVLLAFGDFWFSIYVAILFGNAAGLFLKFVADKYWVFEDHELSIVANSRQFVFYTMFGVLTTLIFWIVELSFHFAFNSQYLTNVGAIVGLAIGYVVKYNLDKAVTFSIRHKIGVRFKTQHTA